MIEQQIERQIELQEQKKINPSQNSRTNKLNPLLKEYTCRVFDKLVTSSYTNFQSQACITFKSSNPTKLLPKYYHDKTCDKLYILKWTQVVNNQGKSKISLQILEILGGAIHNSKRQEQNLIAKLNQRIWRFQISHEPQDIAIVMDYVYFVAGNLLISLKLVQSIPGFTSNALVSETLSYKKIQQIYGLLQNGQPSAIFYLRDENNNLFTRQIINNQLVSSSWGQTLNTLTSKVTFGIKKFAKKQLLKSCFFQVLVPKVLGICFESQSQLYLVNLATFQEVPNTRRTLTEWSLNIPQRTKIVLKSVHNKKLKNRLSQFPQNPQVFYDDILMICVAQKNHFEHFKLSLKLKKNVSIHPYSQYYALQILEQKIIDWSNCSFQNYLVVCHDYNSIQDLEYTKGGLILQGIEHPLSRVSNYCFYPDANQQLGTVFNILTHQAPIWNSFLNSQTSVNQRLNFQFNFQFQEEQITHSQVENSIFKANKFSVPYIFNVLKKGTHTSIAQLQKDGVNIKKLTFQWFKDFKAVKIVQLKGQIFLLRQHSLSVLIPIQPFQFKIQNSKAQKLYKTLSYRENPENFIRKNQIIYNFHDSLSEQEFNDQLSRISIGVKKWHHINFKDTFIMNDIQISQIVSNFIGICNSFIDSIQYLQSKDELVGSFVDQKQGTYFESNGFPFPSYYAEVISNRVRDLIQFQHKFLSKYAEIFDYEALSSQISKSPSLEALTGKYKRCFGIYRPLLAVFQFYSHLACKDLKRQHANYFQDIFTKFIKQQSNLQDVRIFTGMVNSDSILIMGRLFQSLIPSLKTEKPGMFWFQQASFKKRNHFIQMLISQYRGGFKVAKSYLESFVSIFVNKQCFPLNLSSLSASAIINHKMNPSLYGSLICNFYNSSAQLVYEILSELPMINGRLDVQSENDKENLCRMVHSVFPQCEIMLANSQNPKKGKQVIKAIINDYFPPSKAYVFRYEQLYEIMQNTSQTELEQIIHNINLKFIEKDETTNLIQFWISVFRLRCYIFNHTVLTKVRLQKNELLELLQKCRVALISFKTYFFEIYPFADRFTREANLNRDQNIHQRNSDVQKWLDDQEYQKLEDQWLLNSQFVPCRIEIMGRLATFRWINLLRVSLLADLQPMSFKIDQNNQVIVQQQYTVDFIDKLGNFLLFQSMKSHSIRLLKRVIEMYGVHQINTWICAQNLALADYNRMSGQFKSYLKYSKVNYQQNPQTTQAIAKKMKYRNAYAQNAALEHLTEIRDDDLRNKQRLGKLNLRSRQN